MPPEELSGSTPDDTARDLDVSEPISANGVHHDDVVASENDDSATATATEGTDSAEPVIAPDDGTAFMADLVKAMQTTAGTERARLAEDTDRRRDAHLAKIQARREAETAQMRRLADEDLKAIDSWADEERARIAAEHKRRSTALRKDLEVSLTGHSAKIDGETASIERAITSYRADLDAFFGGLDRETDPVEIARQARLRPTFPDLDAVGQAAEAEAAAAEATEAAEATDATAAEPVVAAEVEGSPDEPAAPVEAASTPGIAVMDQAGLKRLADSWATWSTEPGADGQPASGASAETSTATADGAVATADGAVATAVATATAPVAEATMDELVPITTATVSSSGSLLQSVPISRPMSWLRRDRDHSGDADR